MTSLASGIHIMGATNHFLIGVLSPRWNHTWYHRQTKNLDLDSSQALGESLRLLPCPVDTKVSWFLMTCSYTCRWTQFPMFLREASICRRWWLTLRLSILHFTCLFQEFIIWIATFSFPLLKTKKKHISLWNPSCSGGHGIAQATSQASLSAGIIGQNHHARLFNCQLS